jgi:GNAT superfamily N-acetyltransferase
MAQRVMVQSSSPQLDGATGSVDHAIEVFVRGFSFTRSFTHPYVPERVGPLWVMRDAPRTSGDVRNEEWVASGVEPVEVDRIVRKQSRGRFAICAILPQGAADEAVRKEYRKMGYRLGRTEPMMVHGLKKIGRATSPAKIERVTTLEMAERLARTAGRRQILADHLNDESAPIRQYVAMIDGKPVGWVGSIVVGDATWCSNTYVGPKHRRQGIASAMLAKMLTDDRRNGAKVSVLLASHVGSRLYEAVGFEQIATLYLWTPPRHRA